jgi:hypothetical protein
MEIIKKTSGVFLVQENLLKAYKISFRSLNAVGAG